MSTIKYIQNSPRIGNITETDFRTLISGLMEMVIKRRKKDVLPKIFARLNLVGSTRWNRRTRVATIVATIM